MRGGGQGLRARRLGKGEGGRSNMGKGRAWHKIVILLLLTVIRNSLPLLGSNDYVLKSTSNNVMSNDVTSNDLVLYI